MYYNLYPSLWFVMTQHHLKLLRHLNIVETYMGEVVFGVDREHPYGEPYGPSDIFSTVEEILQLPYAEDEEERIWHTRAQNYEIESLHTDMPTALQVLLHVGSMQPGVYHRADLQSHWKQYPLDVSIPILGSAARYALITFLTHPSQYVAEWNIAEYFGQKRDDSTRTNYSKALEELEKAGLITRISHQRYQLRKK